MIKGQLEILAMEQADFEKLELAEIIDARLLQSLVDDFYAFAHIPMSILDRNAKVLVRVGTQDICTRFHRANPESCKDCVASGIELPVGVKSGEYRVYKCKNKMWDVVTPLMLRDTHVGNLFAGQFFFDDEELDYAAFRAQAQQYGFNEEQYIAALEAVPRISREYLNTCMTFLTKLAHMISQMSYSNLELARTLAEREQTQKRIAHLASFPELNPNPIFETDTTGRLTYLNPAGLLRFPDLMETPEHPVLMGCSSVVTSLKEGAERSIVREVEADGSVFHQVIHYIPERDIVRAYFVDITKRKRAEQALIRSETLASVGRMVATVAHEINNPMEAVANCIYLTTSNPKLDPELKEHLETAEREIQRVAQIARQTLGFCRENTKPSAVDIRSLVDEVVELYSPKFKAKDIRLSIEHGSCCSRVVAVAGEIRQVISNLLVNAVDASKLKGSLRIRTSRVSLQDSAYIRVTVADTGTGIQAACRSRIFEPFFTTKGTMGTGLGLWVSQEIIEKHKGRIWVRSVEGKGTTFSVLIPAFQSEHSATAIA